MFIPRTYTVESVTSGHPDKICDQISDAILDACLAGDPNSRVAVEAFGGHGLVLICGEVTTSARVDYAGVARRVYREIGYEDAIRVITNVVEQSRDIGQGVDTGGAGDQGIMYGFATDETPEYLPRGVVLAHALTRGLERLRRSGEVAWLRPDGKAQVTMEDGKVKTVLVSCQHAEGVDQKTIFQTIVHKLVIPTLCHPDPERSEGEGSRDPSSPSAPQDDKAPLGDEKPVTILVNPTGAFVRGGFDADTGLTGRKIMVDTYGGFVPHGGGAFSGKDATKVDRSAAYMARFVAREIVRSGAAHQCLVSVAYAIGVAEPVMIQAVNENGEDLSRLARAYDFRPNAIIERLGLRRPIFQQTASYGHFGTAGLPWES